MLTEERRPHWDANLGEGDLSGRAEGGTKDKETMTDEEGPHPPRRRKTAQTAAHTGRCLVSSVQLLRSFLVAT